MADSLSGTPPKSELLLKLAQMLRSGGEKVAKYEPKYLPLISGTLESLGKGTEGWAYGDSPIDKRSNTPLVNDKTLDMLGALPIGTAGSGVSATKAALLPAIPSMFRFTDPKLAKALTDQIKQANEMRRTGADFPDIWEDTGLFLYPGHSGKGTAAGQAKWGFETEPGRFLNDGELSGMGIDPSNLKAPLSLVLDDPALFRRVPALRHVDFATGQKVSSPVGGRGHFSPREGPMGEIAIGSLFENGKPRSIRDLTNTKHHELNHAINEHFGQAGSVGYAPHAMSAEANGRASNIIEELRKQAPELGDEADLLLGEVPAHHLTRQSDYYRRWSNSSGEQLANEAGARGVTGELRGRSLPEMPETVRFQVPDNLSRSLGQALHPIGRNPQASGLSDASFARQLVMKLRKESGNGP